MHLSGQTFLLAVLLPLAVPPLATAAPGAQKAGGTEALSPAQLDQAPKPIFMARPQYPGEARKAKRTGEVMVSFIVDEKGVVRNPIVARSTSAEFEAAAVEAVGKWRFQPGRKNGRDVATHMAVPIVFTLDPVKK